MDLIVERLVEHGSLGRPVEVIRQEHRISFGSDAFAEVAYHRAQAQRIRPNQHSRMRTFRRVNEDRVAGAVRRFDINVGFDDRQFFACRRTSSSAKTGCQWTTRRSPGVTGRRATRHCVLDLSFRPSLSHTHQLTLASRLGL